MNQDDIAKWRKNSGKKAYATDVQIIEMLVQTRGHIANAARKLGYTPGSLRQIISKNPILKKAKDDIREGKLDDAEQKLDEHIYDKDSLPALLEYLKAAGKKRGYGSQSIDMYLDGKVEHTVDDVIIQGLLEKFESKIKEEAEDEQK